MRIVEPGHVYGLEWLDGSPVDVPSVRANTLTFVNREEGVEHPGAQNQEVLRALIDRVKYLDIKQHWDGNEQIIHHLRMALALHEARVIERKTELGHIHPEHVVTDVDGHFRLLTEVETL